MLIPNIVPTQAYSFNAYYLGPGRETIKFQDEFSGSYVILDALATWCSACTLATYNLRDVHDYIKTNDSIRIISMSVDPAADNLVKLKNFMDTYGGDWDYGLDQWKNIRSRLNISNFPSMYLLDPQGVVIDHWRGVKQSEDILLKLDQHLGIGYQPNNTEASQRSNAGNYIKFLYSNPLFIISSVSVVIIGIAIVYRRVFG